MRRITNEQREAIVRRAADASRAGEAAMKRYIEVFVFWLAPILAFVFGAVWAVEWLIERAQP